MQTPTRLQRWIGDRLVERGHPPLPELVTDLRSQGLSWRQCAAQITTMANETVTDVSLWTWFKADDDERAA
jgi:hypothetical protein